MSRALTVCDAYRAKALAVVSDWDATSTAELVVAICAATGEPLAEVLADVCRRENVRVYWPHPEPVAPFYAALPAVGLPAPGWVALHATEDRMTLREGNEVAVEMDDRSVRAFTVRHRPWQHGPGCALLIGLEGLVGGYDLDRVRARKAGAA